MPPYTIPKNSNELNSNLENNEQTLVLSFHLIKFSLVERKNCLFPQYKNINCLFPVTSPNLLQYLTKMKFVKAAIVLGCMFNPQAFFAKAAGAGAAGDVIQEEGQHVASIRRSSVSTSVESNRGNKSQILHPSGIAYTRTLILHVLDFLIFLGNDEENQQICQKPQKRVEN